MKVRYIHTYIKHRSYYLLFALSGHRGYLLSAEWALLGSPENERSVRSIGFARLFFTLLGAQIIRTLSHSESF